ncbi:putative N-acetyltransferase B complex, non-catalytic subunit [Septoria linicola]|nr:putative N-acetyltransferase B complex, non-catalytic subunit [Septoria linicola]
MARYPTYEEYAKNGKFKEGIARCDDLLKKNSKDVSLLITKLQLSCNFQPSSPDGPSILDRLVAIQPPIQDLDELVSIEIAVVDSFKNTYPPPRTLGPAIAKLWDNAYKTNSNVNYRSELLTVRYQRAIYDNRIQDVQQTLIQLKQFQPKNRTFYMAHAAYTQISSKGKDDLQSKLALGLARKAVSEKFDDDPKLDCRVAGQIFAVQNSEKDLEGIRARQAFRESKQVYNVLQLHRQHQAADAPQQPTTSDSTKQTSREWLESASESLKTQFKRLVNDNGTAEALKKFVVGSIQLFHKATTELVLGPRKRAAADPCFLAISGLVKLYSDSRDQAYLLKSAYLAEQLLNFEPHVHEARLILVYLYMSLGLGSEAMRLFDSLSIKEVQYDTVGHTLFTRLSTIHPFQTRLPSGDIYEPHEWTNKALQVPSRHENKLFEAEAAVLEHNQTGMIFELNGLRDEIRQSFMRRVILLEHRRTARISGKGYGRGTSDIGPRLSAAWTSLKDNRDFNATFDFGYNVEKALFVTRSNGEGEDDLPGQTWLLLYLGIDQAWSIASKQVSLISDDVHGSLTSALDDTASNGQLTHAESLTGRLVITLLPVLNNIKDGKPPTKQDIDALVMQVQRLDIDVLCSSKDPLAKSLHEHYLYIDILLIVVRSCKFIKETTMDMPEISALQSRAMAHIRSLQGHATELAAAKNVFRDNVSGMLKQESDIEEVLSHLDSQSLAAFAERVAQSAKEGWEGVSKIAMSG